MDQRQYTVLEILREAEDDIVARPKGFPLGFLSVLRDLERRVERMKSAYVGARKFSREDADIFKKNLEKRLRGNIETGTMFFSVSELATIEEYIDERKGK